MEPASVVAIISVSMTGIVALVQTLFHNMAQSRCVKLKCWGCECIRDVMTADELEAMNDVEKE